jgi:drug/metabolite transporter (DMT)-like permease
MQNTSNLRAISWNLLSCLFLAVMMCIVRYLSQEGVATFQIVFFRNFFSVMFFLPFMLRRRKTLFNTKRVKLHLVRGINGQVCMIVWFYAIAMVPLSLAVSFSFSVPLIVALLSIPIFGERYGIHRWSALIIGFLGTLVILRPAIDNFNWGIIVLIASCFGFAFSSILIKMLSKTEPPSIIAFYLALMGIPISLPFALYYWQPLELHHWFWLLILGGTAIISQTSLARSFAMADFAVLLPFDFSRLIFVSVIAYFAFNEVPDFWSIVGGLIIMLSTIYTAYRARAKRVA